jgi:hypothetical protein
MRGETKNLVLAQAVSELAALLDYKQQRTEAMLLHGEANELAIGRSDRGHMYALQRLNRIRGGIQTVMRLPLEPDERTHAETIALRIQRAIQEN